MEGSELYTGLAMMIGQFILILGSIWGLVSYRFNASDRRMEERLDSQEKNFYERLSSLEKVFNERMAGIRQMYEADVRILGLQVRDSKDEADSKSSQLAKAVEGCVSVAVCMTRREYEDRVFGLYEKSLLEISKKLDALTALQTLHPPQDRA